MTTTTQRDNPEVVDAGDTLVVKYRGRSAPVVAKILGRELTDAHETLWIDRLLHEPGQQKLGEWEVSGAISSILHRVVEVQ